MEPSAPPRRGLPCWIRSVLLLLACLIVWGVVRAYQNFHAGMQGLHSAENLDEISIGFIRYADHHNGHYPDRVSEVLAEYDLPPERFIVPWGSATPASGNTLEQRAAQMDAGGHCSYAYLGAGRTEKDLTYDMVLMYEADGRNPNGFVFCLFGDGHGEALEVPQAIAAIARTVKAAPATQPATMPATTSRPSR